MNYKDIHSGWKRFLTEEYQPAEYGEMMDSEMGSSFLSELQTAMPDKQWKEFHERPSEIYESYYAIVKPAEVEDDVSMVLVLHKGEEHYHAELGYIQDDRTQVDEYFKDIFEATSEESIEAAVMKMKIKMKQVMEAI